MAMASHIRLATIQRILVCFAATTFTAADAYATSVISRSQVSFYFRLFFVQISFMDYALASGDGLGKARGDRPKLLVDLVYDQRGPATVADFGHGQAQRTFHHRRREAMRVELLAQGRIMILVLLRRVLVAGDEGGVNRIERDRRDIAEAGDAAGCTVLQPMQHQRIRADQHVEIRTLARDRQKAVEAFLRAGAILHP